MQLFNSCFMNLRFPGQYADSETGLFYNYFRNYMPNQGRYTQNDPIGLGGGWNRFGYVEGNPLTMFDPLGLDASMPGYRPPGFVPPRPTTTWPLNNNVSTSRLPGASSAGAAVDFWRNYRDMRDANTVNADKYFHCKANCEATRRGRSGERMACLISDSREWFDQNIKGDPASASEADQAANSFGRNHADTSGSCDVVCGVYRPRGLPFRY